MRVKNLILCSASAVMLAMMADPLAAQTVPPVGVPDPTDEDAPNPDPAPDDEAEGEEIVVTGLRRSIQSSQAIKRDADQIVDAIVAEDIGKLPDLTASASLARVTGVQVSRAAGEAADVQVRGLPNISTTYNGREIFTAENRNVAIQDFPAGGVAALEVYKASTANLIEGGIGGQVNVRSRRPFDFTGLELAGSFNGVLFDQSQRVGFNGNLLFSNRWEIGAGEIGFLVNVAAVETFFLDSTREQSLVSGVAVPDTGASGTFRPANNDTEFRRADSIRFPDATALFYGQGDRWRPSVNAAFQFKTDDLEFYVDGLFQGYRANDSDRFFFVPLFGDPRFTNVTFREGSTRQVQSFTATNAVRPDGNQGARDVSTDTYQIGGGAIFDNGPLRLSADVAYTDTTFEDNQTNVDYAFASSPVRDVDFDVPGNIGGPSFSFRDFNGTDLRNFLFRGLFDRRRIAEGQDIQARGDAEYEVDLGFISRVQAGVRFNDRDATRRDGERYRERRPGDTRSFVEQGTPFSALPLEFRNIPTGFRNDNLERYRVFVAPTAESIRGNVDALRTFVGFPTGDVPFEDQRSFAGNEKAYAAYGQLKYEFDPGIPIDGLIGLRAIRTETEITGTSRVVTRPTPGGPEVVNFVPVTRSNEYTDYLPNASARLRLTEQLQLRAAYTETRTRPNFDQLNPSANIGPPPSACIPSTTDPTAGPNSPNCFRSGGGGNPNLQPIESTNYDLSLEYYFSRTGSATLAAFRRDVDGFISNFDIEVTDPEFGRLRLNAPDNGGKGRLQGIEAALTTFFDFDFVPDWARAFGIQANYTYIDAKSELPPALADNLPAGREGRQRITGVSKHAYNVVALYEIPTFSARLAYNYRSNFVGNYERIFDVGLLGAPGGPIGPTLPLIEDGRGVLDFSTSITPIENITFAFDVSNILGEPIRTFRQYNATDPAYPRAVKYLERTFSAGVRFRF